MGIGDHIKRRLLDEIPTRTSEREAIWIHGVSVGEVLAARPLIEAFRAAHPDWDVIVSSSTLLGVETTREKFPDAIVLSFPLDLPWRVRKAFDRLRPDLVLIVEHDLWPSFLHCAAHRDVPVVLVNGRLSERSRRRLGFLGPVIRRPLRSLTAICAQDDGSASGFARLGYPEGRLHTTGNLKFDSPPPEEAAGFREAIGFSTEDWILVAGSTHEGEEEAALDALAEVRATLPDARLILVPRRTERCAQVAELIDSRGFSKTFWSGGEQRTEVDVVLVDTMGELAKISGVGDVVFVGGTLAPIGGHNVIEPASLGRPIVIGPHYKNAKSVVDHFLEHEAIRVVADESAFVREVARLAREGSAARALGANARRVVERNVGATARTLDVLERILCEA